ncbi:MAG: bifunctional helix-turn-helix transcriptional regulator/GNAT family N-acetyltransferase [candidate division Zixibacteria bacterium]|nr:bifunctional helix-turn-helix transcriptional regulator/GNAT family N-acetyltransferase [candidate division Zixibacteria bacterium]
MDLIKQLGTLALASRLRQLSEALMQGVDRLYKEQKVTFHPRWFPVAYLLKQKSPMAVTEIAEAVGLTHPAVNQTAAQMTRHGLLLSRKDKKDERRRLLSLSKKGQQTVALLVPLWKIIQQCTDEMLIESGHDFMKAIANIERQVETKGMYERVIGRMPGFTGNRVRFHEYRSTFKKYFRKLNYEWLAEYFEVEKDDEKILSDPQRYIVKPGGQIFFAEYEGEIVGTAALVKHSARTYEIAKMAVTKKHRYRGIGAQLARIAIDKAAALGAGELLVATSLKLEAATNLYRKLGFVEIDKPSFYVQKFKRPTVYMKLEIKKIVP